MSGYKWSGNLARRIRLGDLNIQNDIYIYGDLLEKFASVFSNPPECVLGLRSRVYVVWLHNPSQNVRGGVCSKISILNLIRRKLGDIWSSSTVRLRGDASEFLEMMRYSGMVWWHKVVHREYHIPTSVHTVPVSLPSRQATSGARLIRAREQMHNNIQTVHVYMLA